MALYEVKTREAALALLDMPEKTLLERASAIREAEFGNRIDMCAIINAKSGNCGMNCAFCSQSRQSKAVIKCFDFLSDVELTSRINNLAELDIAHIGIVTSGGVLEDEAVFRLGKIIANLPADTRCRICCSLGRLKREQLQYLFDCGLTRFHHNLESCRSYYPKICTSQTWEQRKATVLAARAVGLALCVGGIFGIGESWADRIDFAFELRELGISNIPINFLHPHPHTPLGCRLPLDPAEAIKIIALFRHILPEATLRICGGRIETLRERQADMFAAGANAIMTGDFLTTKGAAHTADVALIYDNNMRL